MRDYKLTTTATEAAPEPQATDAAMTIGALRFALATIEAAAEFGDGEAVPEVVEDIARAEATLAAALGDGNTRGEVVDALARWHVGAKARAAACAAEATSLAAAAAAKKAEGERREASCRRALDLAAIALRAAGLKEARGSVYRIGLQRNGGVAPLLVPDPAAVPVAWRKAPPEPAEMPPDNARIRAALEAGEVVPGCALGERGERVVVK